MELRQLVAAIGAIELRDAVTATPTAALADGRASIVIVEIRAQEYSVVS